MDSILFRLISLRSILFSVIGVLTAATTSYADATLTSAEGRFTAQVPVKPEITQEVTLNPKGQPITTWHFHMEQDGVTYNISYADDVGETPYDVYNDIAPVSKMISDAIPVKAGNIAGIFFTGTLGADYWYNYHVYQKGERLYYVFIFAPKVEDFGRAQTAIKALNDSFTMS